MATLPLSTRAVRSVPRRAVVMALAAVVVIGATYAFGWLRPVSGPTLNERQPQGFDPAAIALPGGDDPAAAPGLEGRLSLNDQIDFWTKRVERDPRDAISLLYLVSADMAKARLTADLDLYQRAGGLLDRAAQIAPGYPEVHHLQAALAYTLHDFARAESLARDLVAANPQDVGALGILADALVEAGAYGEAGQRYEALSSAAPGAALDARLARLAYVTGHTDQAIERAHEARDLALTDPTINDVAFYQYQLGESARLTGDRDLARDAFQAALTIRPHDLGALLGLARVEAEAGQMDQAIALLEGATSIAPQAESLALLGDLLARTDRQTEADVAYDTVRTIRQLSGLAGSVYDRQLLLFDLDHGGATPDVLARAEAALAVRGDIFGWDVVAWAHFRLGQYAEASAAMQHAVATGCRDARLLFHAGAIAQARGDRNGAERLLDAALALGPALDPRQTDEARSLLATIAAAP